MFVCSFQEPQKGLTSALKTPAIFRQFNRISAHFVYVSTYTILYNSRKPHFIGICAFETIRETRLLRRNTVFAQKSQECYLALYYIIRLFTQPPLCTPDRQTIPAEVASEAEASPHYLTRICIVVDRCVTLRLAFFERYVNYGLFRQTILKS